MGGMHTPHAPNEPMLSADDAFAGAERSEDRWRRFEQDRGLRWVVVELPERTFLALQQVAERQNQTVSRLVGQVMTDLAEVFGPS